MKKKYRLEIDNPGCEKCLHEKSWLIVGPDEIGGSTSYLDEDEAQDICDMLNDAFNEGIESQRP